MARTCKETHNKYPVPAATVAAVIRSYEWVNHERVEIKGDIRYEPLCNFHMKAIQRREKRWYDDPKIQTEFVPVDDKGAVDFFAKEDARIAEYKAERAKAEAERQKQIRVAGTKRAIEENAAKFFVKFSPEEKWNGNLEDRWVVESDTELRGRWGGTEAKIEDNYGQPVISARNTNGTLTPSEARAIAEMLLTVASIAERRQSAVAQEDLEEVA